MYLLWILLSVIGVLFLGLLIYVLTRPNTFRVVREIVIKAPPEIPFKHVNNLRTWNDWSPWAKLDPQMKLTYSDKPEGNGAWYEWNGNNQVGEGKLAITESRPSESLKMKLNFVRPFRANNDVAFNFQRESAGTRVSWAMEGESGLFHKVMGLFMNMDEVAIGAVAMAAGVMPKLSGHEVGSRAATSRESNQVPCSAHVSIVVRV